MIRPSIEAQLQAISFCIFREMLLSAAHLQLLMLRHNDDPGILICSCDLCKLSPIRQLDNRHFRISNADQLNVEFGVVSGIYQVQILI